MRMHGNTKESRQEKEKWQRLGTIGKDTDGE